jgi:hypothetical protein
VQSRTKVGQNKNLFILPDGSSHNILRSIHGTRRQPDKTKRRMISAWDRVTDLKKFKPSTQSTAEWDGEVHILG